MTGPTPDSTSVADDAWTAVPGQDRAVALLRTAAAEPVHAYLFVGPPGAGKDRAALAFAGDVLASGTDDPVVAERHRALAAASQHPDVTFVRREGASILVAQATEIVRLASMKPVEGDRKVLILDEFHLVAEATAGKLLKTIEEPPPGTVFVVLADEIPDELVTIASRCVQVEFPALADAVVADVLQREGATAEDADRVAAVAHGDLDRARLLAADERFALRLAAWRAAPDRLDGSGHAVAEVVAELRAAIDDASSALQARHEAEAAEMTDRIERYGQRGSGAKVLEERHRRQLRRLRTDEVRMGLGELARAYRDRLVEPAGEARVDELTAALAVIWEAVDALVRNPNEELLLQATLLRLPGWPAAR